MNNIEIAQFIRARRRTIGLLIDEAGRLIVRAPLRISMRDVQKIIEEKKAWILRKQQEAQTKFQAIKPKQFISGETFLYLGEHYSLAIQANQTQPFHFSQGFYLATAHVHKAKLHLTKWYREQAQHYFTARANHYANLANLKYQTIRLSNANRQWGSCTVDGRLSLTWRLIMAPLWVIDSVVVHELAHLVHKNHSRRFWQLVVKLMPNYEAADKWLHDHGHLLRI